MLTPEIPVHRIRHHIIQTLFGDLLLLLSGAISGRLESFGADEAAVLVVGIDVVSAVGDGMTEYSAGALEPGEHVSAEAGAQRMSSREVAAREFVEARWADRRN